MEHAHLTLSNLQGVFWHCSGQGKVVVEIQVTSNDGFSRCPQGRVPIKVLLSNHGRYHR